MVMTRHTAQMGSTKDHSTVLRSLTATRFNFSSSLLLKAVASRVLQINKEIKAQVSVQIAYTSFDEKRQSKSSVVMATTCLTQ